MSSNSPARTSLASSPASTSTAQQDSVSAGPGSDPRPRRRAPLYVQIAAWSVPLLVLGQFAMLAIVPVLIVLIASVADARVRALRWYAGLLAALYATPLIIWVARPDGAQSLSKDIDPVFVALIVAASAALIVKIATRRRR